MGTVPSAKDEIRLGQLQFRSAVGELVQKAHVAHVDLVHLVDLVRLLLPGATYQSLGQSPRLGEVSFFTVADDVDDHRQTLQGKGHPAAKGLTQQGGVQGAAGEG